MWRLANSLITLRNQINGAAPNRSKASDGTIGDAAHSSTVSDHNPNAAGVVCAFDITHDPGGGLDAGALAQSLANSRDPRIKYLIFNGRALEPGRFGWGWQPYSGSDPHTNHLHVSVGGNYDNGQEWSIGEGDTEVIKPEDKYRVRVINSEVKGWDFNQVHSGSLDDREMNAWVGQPWTKFLDQAWKEGEAYRAARTTLQDELVKTRDELKNTRTWYENYIAGLKKDGAKVPADANTRLENVKSQIVAVQKIIDDFNSAAQPAN